MVGEKTQDSGQDQPENRISPENMAFCQARAPKSSRKTSTAVDGERPSRKWLPKKKKPRVSVA